MARRGSRHWSESSEAAAECHRELCVDAMPMRDAEDIAERLIDRAGSHVPEVIAAFLGVDVVPTDALSDTIRGLLLTPFPTVQPDLFHELGSDEVQMTTLMLVPRSVRRTARSLIIFHESAHHVFNTFGRPHTHGEVWRLTLAMAYPRRMVREAWLVAKSNADRAEALASLGVVPSWCAEARLEHAPRRPRGGSR